MQTVAWLAGRGVAQSCGLDWEVPEVLYAALQAGKLRRHEFEAHVRGALAAAQAAGLAEGSIDPLPLERLLGCLERRTAQGWRHVFLTTNWNTRDRYARGGMSSGSLDYLLQAQVCVLAGLSFASRLDRALLARAAAAACHTCIVVNEEAADAARACALRKALT